MAVGNRWMLSGGLASGKTHIRALLDDLGVHTIDADAVGHEVLEVNGAAFDAVSARWPEVVGTDGVDRALLANIVFNDSLELAELESITHPLIFGAITRSVEGIETPVVVEMPVLKTLGDDWSRMVVDIERSIQVSRAVGRGMDEADALSRLDSQPSRSEWLAAADLVIPNHGTIEDLERSVSQVLGAIGA